MGEKISLPTYGGQAVIEGVMMRGQRSVAIAMRSPDHQIVIHQEPLGGIYRTRLVKIPFLRGLAMLWDALGLGVRALTISANLQNDEQEKVEGPALFVTVTIALAFAVGLFFLAPAAIGQLTEHVIRPALTAPQSAPTGETASSTDQPKATAGDARAAWLGNLMEGLVRLAILIGYIWLIGRVPDIQRVFAYHGAEHKTINAFEAGAELTPESVARFSIEHPRCGTAFLLTLVVFSVLAFSLLGPLPVVWRLASRILFLPLLAGVAYEYLRWTANHMDSPLVRWLVKPNLALQHLTTRQPSLDMLEVSIAAFKEMRAREDPLAVS